jgi:hypothetical protein
MKTNLYIKIAELNLQIQIFKLKILKIIMENNHQFITKILKVLLCVELINKMKEILKN